MLQPVLVTSATWRRSTMTRGEDSVREEILAEISERDNSRRLVSASARGSRGGSPRQVRRELIWRRGKVMLRRVIRTHPRTARFRTRSPNDQLRRPCCPHPCRRPDTLGRSGPVLPSGVGAARRTPAGARIVACPCRPVESQVSAVWTRATAGSRARALIAYPCHVAPPLPIELTVADVSV